MHITNMGSRCRYCNMATFPEHEQHDGEEQAHYACGREKSLRTIEGRCIYCGKQIIPGLMDSDHCEGKMYQNYPDPQ